MHILLAIEKAITVRDDDCEVISAVKNKMGQEIEKGTQDTDLALTACTLNPFTKHLIFLGNEYQTRATEFLEQAALDVHHQVDGRLKIKRESNETVSQTETVHNDQPLPLIAEPPLPTIP